MENFLAKLPLAVAVFTGGFTWLAAVFFLFTAFTNKTANQPQFYLQQADSSSCRAGINSFYGQTPCQISKYQVGFRSAKFICFDGLEDSVGNSFACKTERSLRQEAQTVCQKRPVCAK